jgi:transposase-like protein
MKPIVKLSFLSALFSLVYLLLDQFGFIRYLTCYLYSANSYLESYKNVEKYGEERTVITLSTTYNRLNKVVPVLKSLLDQTVRVDMIYVTVCGTNIDVEKNPDTLSTLNNIKKVANVVELKDCKHPNVSQLYTAITREGDTNTLIITVGDDIIYGKDFIETLLDNIKDDDKIVFVSDGEDGNVEHNIEHSIEHSIDLSKGVLFKTRYFSSKFIKELEYKNRNWINEYSKSLNIPVKPIKYSGNIQEIFM